MSNLINDPYVNDLKYFSDKLNYFLDSELYEILYEDNKDIQTILQKYLIQTARSSFSTQAKRIRPMLCYWLFRNFYMQGNFTEKLSNIKLSEKKIFEKMNKAQVLWLMILKMIVKKEEDKNLFMLNMECHKH